MGLEASQDAGHQRVVTNLGPRAVAGDSHEHLFAGGAEAVAPGELQQHDGRARVGLGDGAAVVEVPIPHVLQESVVGEGAEFGRGQRAITGEERLLGGRDGLGAPAAARPAGFGGVRGHQAHRHLAGRPVGEIHRDLQRFAVGADVHAPDIGALDEVVGFQDRGKADQALGVHGVPAGRVCGQHGLQIGSRRGRLRDASGVEGGKPDQRHDQQVGGEESPRAGGAGDRRRVQAGVAADRPGDRSLFLQQQGESAQDERGDAQHGEPGEVVPFSGDIDAGVGHQGEAERPRDVHGEGQRRGQHDQQHAGPRTPDERGGKEDRGHDAGQQAAHPAARLLDADAGVGEQDDVARFGRGDAEQVQGVEHDVGHPKLELQREPRVGAGRDGRAQGPEPRGDQRGPVERQGAHPVCAQPQQRGQQQRGQCQRQRHAHERVRPVDARCVECGDEGKADSDDEQGSARQGESAAFGRIKGRALPPAFVEQEQKQHGGEQAVREVGVV